MSAHCGATRSTSPSDTGSRQSLALDAKYDSQDGFPLSLRGKYVIGLLDRELALCRRVHYTTVAAPPTVGEYIMTLRPEDDSGRTETTASDMLIDVFARQADLAAYYRMMRPDS